MARMFSISLFFVITIVTSCSKDKLSNEYEMFKGAYNWTYTPADNNNIFSNNTYNLNPTNTGFSASIQLNSTGEVIFLKNGEQVTKNKYTITDKSFNSAGNGHISIKLKGTVKGLNINKNTLKLVLSNDTLLEIDEFPFPSLESVDTYKNGYSLQGSNKFRKN